ncbi:MAG: cysteine synthase A [Clostridia bacterium]|nr:cysteine synthase A [Clostridia bacterium]
MNIQENIEKTIGNTPLVRLQNIEKKYALKAKLYAKVESKNAGGSIKDRVAKYMIDDAEKSGALKKGGTVIEPTSGNTGVGLALVCASRGYQAVIVMPDTMSIERRKLISAYGAKVILTDGTKGMQGAVDNANELCAKTPNAVIAGQFDNPANPKAHYETTAPEIYDALDGNVDAFLAGVGTGGTITGVGKYLKERIAGVKVYAVEPASSPLLSKGKSGAHGIQGIGANFVPKVLDIGVYDSVLTVTDDDAISMMRELGTLEGIFAGISSGAVLSSAIELGKQEEWKDKNIVIVLPDDGGRYLSII